MENDNKYSVPGLERGLRILRCFSAKEPVQNGADLSRRLGIPRSTVFRLLQTLEAEGFIERAGDDSNYRLGIAVLQIGFEYLSSLEVTDLGASVIERLCQETGFSSHIVALDGREAVFVAKAASPERVFGTVKIGTRLPAHATGVGQVLLGDYNKDALRKLFPERKLEEFTPHTPATVAALYDAVQESTQRGYGVSESFFEQGISTIAAPVRDHQGKIVAAISITVPQQRLDAELLADGLIDKVRAAAAELSQRLNYRPAALVAR
ncbi:IclR family transcriptional regulator [Paraburkholderia sediminicola]|uniref:IclR family transcriptional regulator n=1 Tax=Paraburkholderia sediminicola TaxID=458836 RepID=UPI0038B7A5D4